MGIVVDLKLWIDGLNIESEDDLINLIHEFNEKCDSIYDVYYEYEVVDGEE